MNIDRLISADSAIQIADGLVRAAALHGMRPFTTDDGSCRLSVEFKRAWSVECSLYVTFDSGERTPLYARRSSTVEDHVWVQRPKIEITWSSTGRSVACATASVALYRQVAELAALIEARLDEETVGWTESARLAKKNADHA